MKQYHKIHTVFKRDGKNLILGDYSTPEFKYLKGNEWVFTEKVDGTNIRLVYDGQFMSIKGKSDRAQIQTTLHDALSDLFYPQIKLLEQNFSDGVCFYGEGYGARIQKGGGLYRSDQGFVLFDVRVGHWWLNRESVEAIAKTFSMDVVPIVGRGTLASMVDLVRSGFKSKWDGVMPEGVVARPAIEVLARSGQRIITKLKHRDFPHEQISHE